MKPFNALSIVLLAASASASPVITVPLTKLQRTGSYPKGALFTNRARAVIPKARQASGPTSVPATKVEYLRYATRVGIGSPPTYYNFIVDTGSSNTIVGYVWMFDRRHATYDSSCSTNKTYVRTSTSIRTTQNVSIEYNSGKFEGLECKDHVISSAPDH